VKDLGDKHRLRIASKLEYKGYIHCIPCKKPLIANYNTIYDHTGESKDGVLKGNGNLGALHVSKLENYLAAEVKAEKWKLLAKVHQIPGESAIDDAAPKLHPKM
jgi:hypothetical protein